MQPVYWSTGHAKKKEFREGFESEHRWWEMPKLTCFDIFNASKLWNWIFWFSFSFNNKNWICQKYRIIILVTLIISNEPKMLMMSSTYFYQYMHYISICSHTFTKGKCMYISHTSKQIRPRTFEILTKSFQLQFLLLLITYVWSKAFPYIKEQKDELYSMI